MHQDPREVGERTGGSTRVGAGSHRSAASWHGLVEHLPEGVVVADREQRLVWANRLASRLLGFDLSAQLGEPVAQVLPWRDAHDRPWWACQNAWAGLHTRTGAPEQRVRLGDDDSAVLLAARFVRRPADRSVEYVVCTMRSTHARERVERDSAALISTVAHELRSPLTSVRGFSRTLQDRWDQLDDEQKQWMLQAIETDTGRLSRLVGELLDLSRIDAGRLHLRRQPIDLGALVHEQVGRLVSAGHDPARFEIITAPEPPSLWGDHDRLVQIVGNLLENAIRHGAGKVTARIGQDADHAVLTIADQGPGISEHDREAVFSRFWQGSARGGSGLGLHVVRGLVQAHGGQVQILDVPQGATFQVRLPSDPPDHGR